MRPYPHGAPNLHLADDASFLNGTKPHVANLMDVRQTPYPSGLPLWGETPLPSGRGPSALPLAGFPFREWIIGRIRGHRYIASLAP